MAGQQSQMVHVTWYFGWLPYSGKLNFVVLSYFLCLSSSMNLGPSSANGQVLCGQMMSAFQELEPSTKCFQPIINRHSDL